jgi:hypothetical protein
LVAEWVSEEADGLDENLGEVATGLVTAGSVIVPNWNFGEVCDEISDFEVKDSGFGV